jgi:uroporphyrinogen-III synthase
MVEPLLTVAFNEPPADLPDPVALLITSQNAARAIARWPQVADWLEKPVFAAGPATARAVAALGFSDVHAGAGGAGSLADMVIAWQPKNAGPLVYPAARDRAGELAGGLTALGYDVRMVEAYRADPARRFRPEIREAFATGSIDGVLIYSDRTAKAFLAVAAADAITETLARPDYFVISERVAETVRTVGARLHVAASPDEDSLLALIPAPS